MSSQASPFVRSDSAPILSAEDWPYPVNSIFNAGVTRIERGELAGEVLLLCRVEDRRGSSHFCAARSANGIDGWRIDEAPTLSPHPDYPEEAWGIEDPRVVWLEEIERYAITYTSYSELGPAVSLALTDDFNQFDCMGMICVPENKDAALFPKRIDGQWVLIHRPVTTQSGAHIWISTSPDLLHWGSPQPLLQSRPGPWWDSARVGLAGPPIAVSEGWLMLYHGVKETVSGSIYRVGAALLDGEDPTRMLARSGSWCLSPEGAAERSGDVNNVVFPSGQLLDAESGELRVYYGAADTELRLARAPIADLLEWLKAENTIVASSMTCQSE